MFETRSYLRWEEPVLGINGEGRVTPLMPGCQIVYTVIGSDGKTVALNQIGKSPDEQASWARNARRIAIDMAPVQPHSAQRKARTCESCHNNPKAMGYGISGGVFQTRYPEDIVEDLIDQKTGQVIPGQYKIQIPKIARSGLRLVHHHQGWPAGADGRYPLAAVARADRRDACRHGAHRAVHGLPPRDEQRSAVGQGGQATDSSTTSSTSS